MPRAIDSPTTFGRGRAYYLARLKRDGRTDLAADPNVTAAAMPGEIGRGRARVAQRHSNSNTLSSLSAERIVRRLPEAEVENAKQELRVEKTRQRNKQDEENVRPTGVHTQNDDVNTTGRPWGNSAARAHRMLRTARPDIHQRVLAGEITAHAAQLASSCQLLLLGRHVLGWGGTFRADFGTFRVTQVAPYLLV